MADGQIGGAADDRQRKFRYVDLTLGAWRPREAARQLGLGLDEATAAETRLSPIAITGGVIDIEADADPVIAAAHDDAVRIARRLPPAAVVVVLAPRFGLALRSENEWFFLFLRRLGVSVAILGDEPAVAALATPPFERRRDVAAPQWRGWPPALDAAGQRLLRLFPGLLPRALAERHGLLAGLVELAAVGPDHFLIPAGYRDKPPGQAARDFDLMDKIEAEDEGFRAFGQCHCHGHFTDATKLATLGRQCFLDGGVDLARELLERARAAARGPVETGLVDVIRQELRIFEGRFTEAAAVADPSRRVPPAIVSRIKRLRGLAAAMNGDRGAAERDLAGLLDRIVAREKLSADNAFLLDRLAGARLAAGDLEGAAGLAGAVGALLADETAGDRRVAFLNAVTIAAIRHRRGDGDGERGMLAGAFASGVGARSLAEIVEMNVAEARAERDPRAAAVAWLRAAFAWLAVEPTEAFSRRVAATILGRAPPARADLDTEISEALGREAQKAWPDFIASARTRLPAVRAAGKDQPVQPEKLFGAAGIAVLWGQGAIVTPVYPPPRSRLVRLAVLALGELCPASNAAETGTILVDVNLGIDLPRNRSDAMTVALRAGVKEMIFAKEAVVIADSDRRRRTADLQIGLSASVIAIETGEATVVRFRRNLPDRVLSKDEAALIEPFRAGGHLSLAAAVLTLGRSAAELETAFRRLEAERIIRMEANPRLASLHEDRHPV